MKMTKDPLPPHMEVSYKVGDEISITGKWSPIKNSGHFKKSDDSVKMYLLFDRILNDAKNNEGILSAQVNKGVGDDSGLIHMVFADSDALINYYNTKQSSVLSELKNAAKPELHLVRGISVPKAVIHSLNDAGVPNASSNYLYGYVRNEYKQPNKDNAIQVTAKWTCKSGVPEAMDELRRLWQKVGMDAYSIETGLLRFEAFEVFGENALIIQETFENTEVLKFHLSKGTAAKYKKDIDKVADPETYYFRGPVSLLIRTYAKFLKLPVTFTISSGDYTHNNGSMSDGKILI